MNNLLMLVMILRIFVYLSQETLFIKYRRWLSYIDNCLHTGLLKLQDREHVKSIKTMFFYLTKLSRTLRAQIFRNCSQFPVVKRIIGKIHCCYIFKLKLLIKYRWLFNTDLRLHLNATFVEVNILRIKAHGAFRGRLSRGATTKYDDELLRIGVDKYVHYTHLYLAGRRNIFTIVSVENYMFIILKSVTTVGNKLNVFFTIIDSTAVQQFNYNGYKFTKDHTPTHKKSWKLDIKEYYTKIKYNPENEVQSYYILIKKHLKALVKFIGIQVENIKLYDGPDGHTSLIHLRRNEIKLSTFQCFIQVNKASFGNTTPRVIISSANEKHVQSLKVVNTSVFTLNMCGRKQVQHCIINVTAIDKYINLSIVSMIYNGPDILNCNFGGVSYLEKVDDMFEDRKSFCDSYTQHPKKDSFDKVPMDFVSKDFEALIVIYGYYPYNKEMDLKIEISETSCKGIFPCDNGNLFLKNRDVIISSVMLLHNVYIEYLIAMGIQKYTYTYKRISLTMF